MPFQIGFENDADMTGQRPTPTPLNTEFPTHPPPMPVSGNEVRRPHRAQPPGGHVQQPSRNPIRVLRERHQFSQKPNLRPKLTSPSQQNRLDVILGRHSERRG